MYQFDEKLPAEREAMLPTSDEIKKIFETGVEK